jgi:hypothetical protein
MDPRVIKPKTPPRVIVTAVLIALFVLGFIFFAVFQSGRGISDARMRGIVVAKEFTPQPETQITLGRKGSVTARERDGIYLLTVEVPQPDGTKKPYYVEIKTKDQYDAIKIGDTFDVGPYLEN